MVGIIQRYNKIHTKIQNTNHSAPAKLKNILKNKVEKQ